jgi:hypothetical protein
VSGDKSGAKRDRDREIRGENSEEQDAFNKNQQGLGRETFNGNDDETRQIDGKKPKMSIEKDDDMDIEEGDEEMVPEVHYENIDEENTNPGNTDDEEQDGSDPIPGKD